MQKFKFTETYIKDLFIIETVRFSDSRGYFSEIFNESEFNNNIPNIRFVQENLSKSSLGVLRGMHYQIEHPQGKLVSVLYGKVFDVAIDLRKNSPTYLKWYGITLSSENGIQMYIPENFAHGFLVLSDSALFKYKCTEYYFPKDEGGIAWDDPSIGIQWPLSDIIPILSDKDLRYKFIEEKSGGSDEENS